ncbi:hypothetical protein IQ251_05160 [Saccharopolyspora sp. HNM0983]|uniref:Uncharacterized protein n=1 Tax=Saccharopolyspora montiporae TaxID=2781240 RepID=A0A929FYU1_9PSEU|nr:hypothetical protein [Saccharopolyspora sp. HNM0983]MBE9373835.1 hypothetical protein [Saccharopolyspora sp. HNM0983]
MAKLSTRRVAGVAVAAGALLLSAPAAALADGYNSEASYVGPGGVGSQEQTAVVDEDGNVFWHAEASHVGPDGIYSGELSGWEEGR